MPSTICDASTNFASTLRSLGESFETSAVISVGTKRAIICPSLAWSGGFVSCALTKIAGIVRSARESLIDVVFMIGGSYQRKCFPAREKNHQPQYFVVRP